MWLTPCTQVSCRVCCLFTGKKKKKKMPWKGRVCPRVCPRFFNLEGSDTRGNPSNGTNFSWDSTARKKTNTSQYP